MYEGYVVSKIFLKKQLLISNFFCCNLNVSGVCYLRVSSAADGCNRVHSLYCQTSQEGQATVGGTARRFYSWVSGFSFSKPVFYTLMWKSRIIFVIFIAFIGFESERVIFNNFQWRGEAFNEQIPASLFVKNFMFGCICCRKVGEKHENGYRYESIDTPRFWQVWRQIFIVIIFLFWRVYTNGCMKENCDRLENQAGGEKICDLSKEDGCRPTTEPKHNNHNKNYSVHKFWNSPTFQKLNSCVCKKLGFWKLIQ